MSPEPPARLDEVLAYTHPGVLRRYLKDYGGPRAEAEEVFVETLKWLYLSNRGAERGHACWISPELEKIDRMWHTFLLFTRDYAAFCDRYFGAFLHHAPADPDERPEEGETRERLAAQFGLVYDVLGEGTLATWYDECRYAAPA